jgi:hypothetical protein
MGVGDSHAAASISHEVAAIAFINPRAHPRINLVLDEGDGIGAKLDGPWELASAHQAH